MSAAQDWRRLADLVVRRRMDELMWTQVQVSAEGGPSTATQRHIEGASKPRYSAATLQRLEVALRWKPGSIRAVLAGGEPTPWEDAGHDKVARDEMAVSNEDVRRWVRANRHLNERDRAFMLAAVDEIENAEQREREAH